jgi:hypothetical protein
MGSARAVGAGRGCGDGASVHEEAFGGLIPFAIMASSMARGLPPQIGVQLEPGIAGGKRVPPHGVREISVKVSPWNSERRRGLTSDCVR